MATINNKLIHFKSKSDFNSRYRETTDDGDTYGDFLGTSIVFIQDAKQIWTHGQFYDANETTLASLGITATATELNYVDGVTSNIQTQLNGKANTSQLNNYLPLSGGTMTGELILPNMRIGDISLLRQGDGDYSYLNIDGNVWVGGAIEFSDRICGTGTLDIFGQDSSRGPAQDEGTVQIHGGQSVLCLNQGGLTLDGVPISLQGHKHTISNITDFTTGVEDVVASWGSGWQEAILGDLSDTKNTTGTSNSTSKLFLAGGTSQSSTGVVTYSNSAVYTQSGQLYATRMNATNGFYETSDARLKNFKDDIKALDVVSEIPTKYFTWKSDKKQDQHIGTSAQEIQRIYPDLVTENEDGELLVDYARLSIIALAAIKELKKEIDELKSKN